MTNHITLSGHSNKCIIYNVIGMAILMSLISCFIWLITDYEFGVDAGRVSSQQRLIIDTDPGIDDAMALLTVLGDPGVNVMGITCVRGNTDVPNVIINTLKILQIAKLQQIPVYSGKNYGLIESPTTDNWFGIDGFGDVAYSNPPSPDIAQKEHAASFLARIVKEYPGQITVCAIGPLTNIALALHLNPDFLKEVKRIIVMGGSIRGTGNIRPGAEFNFYMDSEAAALVLDRALSSGTIISLLPLETCEDNSFSLDWRWDVLAKINNSAVAYLNQLDESEQNLHPSTVYTPYDTYSIMPALSPDSVTFSQQMYGVVEGEGIVARGVLMVDYVNRTGNVANLEVIMNLNTSAMTTKMLDNLSNFS